MPWICKKMKITHYRLRIIGLQETNHAESTSHCPQAVAGGRPYRGHADRCNGFFGVPVRQGAGAGRRGTCSTGRPCCCPGPGRCPRACMPGVADAAVCVRLDRAVWQRRHLAGLAHGASAPMTSCLPLRAVLFDCDGTVLRGLQRAAVEDRTPVAAHRAGCFRAGVARVQRGGAGPLQARSGAVPARGGGDGRVHRLTHLSELLDQPWGLPG